jgi:hypothetical protein
MKNTIKMIVGIAALSVMVQTAGAAVVYGDITIYDRNKDIQGTQLPALEDNTSEPNTLTGNVWDLEGFGYGVNEPFDNQGRPSEIGLSLVGSFDFQNGIPSHSVTPGALFIDLNYGTLYQGPAVGGSPAPVYDLGIKFNFGNNTYQVYNLATATLINPTDILASSKPWTFSAGKQDWRCGNNQSQS